MGLVFNFGHNTGCTITPAPRTHYVIGADLGQVADPTALCVMRVTETYPTIAEGASLPRPKRIQMDVGHLERLPLRQAYPDQVEHVRRLLRSDFLAGVRKTLVVDQTGVGRPVFDMFERAGLSPIGVTITAGDQETRVNHSNYRVAKLLLISRLQAALHANDLQVASELEEAATLVKELQDFRATFSDAGHASFNAREGAHDDLVLAVAIAAWYAEHDTRNRSQVFTYRA